MSSIMQAIWEPECWDCSYGFRPGRSAHDALRQVAKIVTNERTQWVVEVDIKGFFDNVDHEILMKFVGHRYWQTSTFTMCWTGGLKDDTRSHAARART